MLVSVLIPTYQGAAHIEAAVASALAQTHTDLEVLVGDDGSSDGTAELAERAGAGDGRLRVIRHPRNLGAFENPIALLRQARGELVKYLLHDDVLLPRCVEVLAAGLTAAPDVTLATSKRCVVDGAGRRRPDPPFVQALVAQPSLIDGRALGTAILRAGTNPVGELSTVLMRRADLDPDRLWRLDGDRLAANGDLALFLELMARGRVFATPEELSCFRVHDAQRSQQEAIVTGGIADWPRLVRAGIRDGLLGGDGDADAAWASVLVRACALHLQPLSAAGAAAVDAVIAEALAVLPPVASPGVGARFAAAVAAPALDAASVAAAVAALRALAPHCGSLLIAVDPGHVDRAVALVEPALAVGGPELDADLVPTRDPRALLTPGRLPAGPWAPPAPAPALAA